MLDRVDATIAVYAASTALLALLSHAAAHRYSSVLGHGWAVGAWLAPMAVAVVTAAVRSNARLESSYVDIYLLLLVGVVVGSLFSLSVAIFALIKSDLVTGLTWSLGAALSGAGVLPLWMCVPLG